MIDGGAPLVEQTSKVVSWNRAYTGALFHTVILLVSGLDPAPAS